MRADLKEMWENFETGFWHPFGPYTGLSVAEILEWKRSEVERHGWTFWSFAFSSSTDAWLDLLAKLQRLCSLCALIAHTQRTLMSTEAPVWRPTFATYPMATGSRCLTRAS